MQTFFDLQNIQAVLFQAAPMIMIGLAAALAFRVRFWNLGLEGQMIWGAIGATAISIFEVGPASTRLPLMFATAALAGVLWVLGPALLKKKLGVNEIISTLMLIVGLAGGYISVVSTKLWVDGMTGGRGWIAIGLVIFARWAPWRALAGALLFGAIEALIPQRAAAGVKLPQYFVLMTPYAVTLAVMIWVGLAKRAGDGEPGALGEPFVREERR